MTRRVIVLLLIIAAEISAWGQAEVPEDFVALEISMDLETPVGITFSNSGQAFVWEKDGRVWTMEEDILYPTPIIDITDEVNNQADHGLVGFALDPSFASTGYVYLYYVVDRHHLLYSGTAEYDPTVTLTSQATIGRVTRYTLEEASGFKTVKQGSRKILLGDDITNGLPILMTSHAVGSLVFGTDGSLLLSFGDGGSFTESDIGSAADTYYEQSIADGTLPPEHNVGSLRAMMKGSAHGKILRMDPATGNGLPSNPYYEPDAPDSWRSMVWAMGFRNPYKFMKLPNTGSHNIAEGIPGTLLVGDVGSSYWEEINLITEGGKWYGWPYFEGHTGKWEFYDKTAANVEAPNPLASGDCPEFIDFRSIYSNAVNSEIYELPNPCNTNVLIEDELILKHELPLLAYSSSMWNPPAKTTVPGWNEDGAGIGVSVTDDISGVDGFLLEGGSILPGGVNVYDAYPEEYQGKLFFGDFEGTISTMELDDQQNVVNMQPFATDELGITDLTFNPANGSLYYVHLTRKTIVKVEYGGTLPPTIVTSQTAKYGTSPLRVVLDASESYSNVGGPLTYTWTNANGSNTEGSVLDATYSGNGIPTEHNVTLMAVDSAGKTSIETYTISTDNTPPEVDITSIDDGSTYSIQAINTLNLAATVSDREHSGDDLKYTWRTNLYHDDHYHEGPADTRVQTYTFLDPVGCGIESYSYKIVLTVTDRAGLSGTDTVSVYPYCGEVFAEIVDLTATEADGVVSLQWGTELENEVVSYEVERSADFLYKTIGTKEATGAPYQYADKSPLLGKNLYRIKAYNQGGNYLYSNVAEVIVENVTNFAIFPNPTTDKYTLTSDNPDRTVAIVRAYDVSGQVVYNRTIHDSRAVLQHTIDAQEWPAGLYYISVIASDRQVQQKVLKL